jgi:hypothetical protein
MTEKAGDERLDMNIYRFSILFLIFCLVPVSGYAEVYHYIDKDGVERYSNQPPPEGAKIIGEKKEIKYDKAADDAQAERNREAAAADADQPTPQPAVKPAQSSQGSAGETVIYSGDGTAGEKEYSRRKHHRKKEIRKEKAEMPKAMPAVEHTK